MEHSSRTKKITVEDPYTGTITIEMSADISGTELAANFAGIMRILGYQSETIYQSFKQISDEGVNS